VTATITTSTPTRTLSRVVERERDGTWTVTVTVHSTRRVYVETGFAASSDAAEYAEALEWNLCGRPGLDT